MEKLLELINERVVEWAVVIFATFIGFFIYLTSTTDPMGGRVRGAFQGALIAGSCGLPIWTYIGNGSLGWLVVIVIVLCVTGQFLIEPLQKAVPKLLNKLFIKVEAILEKIFGSH